MSTAQRVIDDIDALVDEQLRQEASGYDYNLNQPRCRCGKGWHGLPAGGCPGSDDEGPLSVLLRPEASQFLATRQAIMTRVVQAFDIPPEIVGLFMGRDSTEGWWTYDPS